MVGTVDEGAVERRDALEKVVVCRERIHGPPVTELGHLPKCNRGGKEMEETCSVVLDCLGGRITAWYALDVPLVSGMHDL